MYLPRSIFYSDVKSKTRFIGTKLTVPDPWLGLWVGSGGMGVQVGTLEFWCLLQAALGLPSILSAAYMNL